jgi:ribosome-associated protein
VARYFIIATATSDPHLNALRGALQDAWVENFSTPERKAHLTCEARTGSGWFVVDAGWLMIHLFNAEQRARYRLEDLWGDARKLTPPASKPKTPRKRAVKK